LVTTPERTAWEIGSEHDLIGAVAALDVLLRHGYVTPDRLALSAAANPRSRAARAIRLADGRAESPPESELRVRFALAGLPPPIPQFDVRHGGAFVARLDLGWPKRKVGCEYDGEHHAELRQFRADRTRLNKLVDAGWTIVHASARDLADKDRFDRLVAQLRSVLGRN
jgi:very-short-patch-repair endonuclease